MKPSSKNMERALLGKEKHRVLVFGRRTCGKEGLNVDIDFCDVEVIPFPDDYEKLENLSNYTLVILDYSVFQAEFRGTSAVHEKEQEVFEKQMFKALDSGTCFCILHYDDIVPSYDPYQGIGEMNKGDIKKCYQLQIGFRWLYKLDVRPVRSNSLITSAQLRRNEFKRYMDHWGASKLYRGFKKSGLFNLYNHREGYDLGEDFPAVLFVNANLNAASWKQKDRPIDKQDYEEAAKLHILAVRIEDLLFAWQALREGIIGTDRLLSIFRNEVGWLEFKRDRSWKILK